MAGIVLFGEGSAAIDYLIEIVFHGFSSLRIRFTIQQVAYFPARRKQKEPHLSTNAFDHIQEVLWHFASHRVLTVAAKTGILSRLCCDGVATEDISSSLSLDALATTKIVRALCAMNIAQSCPAGYRLLPEYADLFGRGEVDMLPFLLHSHELYDRWGATLEAWVRGESAKPVSPSAEQVALFGRAMRSIASEIATRAVKLFDFSEAKTLLDLGGGTGTWAEIFCNANPSLRADVLDLSEVAAAGTARIADTALSSRIAFIGGHYLETPIEKKYDLVLLANVIHQENAEGAARMISRAAAALTPCGRVVIAEFAIDDAQENHLMGALFAINMRSFGDTHTEPSIRAWLTSAGLSHIERIDVDSRRWLFVASA